MLQVCNLSVSIGDTPVLHDLTLTVPSGTLHALLGANGSGKSTLVRTLAGYPGYTVTGGRVILNRRALLPLSPEQRAQAGLFTSLQDPVPLPGVTVLPYLRLVTTTLSRSRGEAAVPYAQFLRTVREALVTVALAPTFLERSVHDGFSGGEKKRLELLQLLLIQPRYAILDEVDAGLDLAGTEAIATVVHQLCRQGMGILLVTHSRSLLQDLAPDTVTVLQDGRIQQQGDAALLNQLTSSSITAPPTPHPHAKSD